MLFQNIMQITSLIPIINNHLSHPLLTRANILLVNAWKLVEGKPNIIIFFLINLAVKSMPGMLCGKLLQGTFQNRFKPESVTRLLNARTTTNVHRGAPNEIESKDIFKGISKSAII